MDKLSYGLGLGIGQQLAQMNIEGLNIDDFAQAIRDVISGSDLKIGHREAQQIVQDYFQKQEEKLNAEREEKGKQAKIDGERYLAENAKKEGVVVTKSGLQYKVLQEGTGRQPKASDSVRCHYEGFLIDGTVFDSSVQRGEPATFGLQQVIAGWTEGLQLMKEGAKYRFFIPYLLGYGPSGAGQSIPPYATLIFDVELLAIV
ncbi:MAG: FKBP-type peptidyl-prolyl cis-trans isomerase [Prevotella sp.]|nr:FKBP-type peptidyl-prolyl cis-trans isomerase [Prevotella sp.]